MQIVAITTEGFDAVGEFSKALGREMKERGIKTSDSDAFDMSRDIMIMDAAASIGYTGGMVGDTIRIAPAGLVVDWDAIE